MSEQRDADPLTDWKLAIRQLGDRLERDYLERVSKVARGFGIWGSSTEVGYEIPLGGRIGRLEGNSARYARRQARSACSVREYWCATLQTSSGNFVSRLTHGYKIARARKPIHRASCGRSRSRQSVGLTEYRHN